MSGETGTTSNKVTITVTTENDGYKCTVKAKANWFTNDGMELEAESGRVIDTYKAMSIKGTTVSEFIESTKRDALRELVTNLNIYQVLS
ncbi:hypothetical protein [Ralstonia phage Reminis]|uniref:Uncharacterized protein n=1 Tax=Ralstonia phage Reminis TaxID=2662139 RepID=A0A5Q2UA35_9CAUD|nr:hypothetical protein [Ralstonia phage Reminis]